ncbi:hypothetical protein HBI13_024980 [Parastagonospora nodorum]|nr:hypothetical protein HBI10_041530 [Parastagonospora nodorum]KAH4030795.1 hypothetical protein HBI13_024980 [Parastagonospora nodorum]
MAHNLALALTQRKDSVFHSRRISGLFIPNLTEVNEKGLKRQASNSSRLSVILSPARHSKDGSRDESLQDTFDNAIPAEAPTDPSLILENKYPAIRSLRTDEDIGDGLWLCCHCRHENTIRHYRDPHPFQYLRCGRCDRGMCTDCYSSEVLTPWPMGMISAPRPAPGREVRYCHVCTNCGLSHRAEMERTTLDFYGITCSGCGTSSYGDWPRYHIGTVEPYRRDPNVSFVKLVMVKAEDAARIKFRYELGALETNMGAELSITNPG